ncbi:MAG: hypothetical protein M0T77_07370, partial [Actinomycetota bacterium]|nr:hypothetical protein [Actinomycetota bacterium]
MRVTEHLPAHSQPRLVKLVAHARSSRGSLTLATVTTEGAGRSSRSLPTRRAKLGYVQHILLTADGVLHLDQLL